MHIASFCNFSTNALLSPIKNWCPKNSNIICISSNITLSCLLIMLASCSGSSNNQQLAQNSSTQAAAPIKVSTTIAQQKTFNHELLCNGTLSVANSAEVGFEAQGIITEVKVSIGMRVKRGDVLATLDNSNQQLALERASSRLEVAQLEMKNFLLGYSSTADTSQLTPQVMQTARIRSGYNEAKLAIREAELQLAKTIIAAPIQGLITDLQAKAHNPTSTYKFLCRIIDESTIQAEFNVLETELSIVSEGAHVEVTPFTNTTQSCKGKITEINRIVDKNGMVKIVAKLQNPGSSFITGMNVRVMVRKPIDNKLVIPIDGLTQRQNRDVVFVMIDSLAHWKYVKVGERNSSEVVILEGLKVGDRVIISGNTTIGHEAWVAE